MDPVNRLLTDLGILLYYVIKKHLKYLVAAVGMKEDEVDEVVLVGGTTRIPRVKSQLRYYHVLCMY